MLRLATFNSCKTPVDKSAYDNPSMCMTYLDLIVVKQSAKLLVCYSYLTLFTLEHKRCVTRWLDEEWEIDGSLGAEQHSQPQEQ